MKKGLIIGILAIVVILIIGGVLLITKNQTYSTPSNNQPAPPGNSTLLGTHSIIISDYTFTPSQLIISVGDTVTWTNNAPMGHTVTSDIGNELSSSTIASGSTYSHTFTTAGTYNYHCSIHPTMIGQIIVQ